MRKLILAAAAALVAVAAPAIASAQTGYVGAVYNDVDSDGADGEVFGLEGSVFFPTSGSLGIEVDAGVLDSDETDEAYGITGHLFTRNENYLFGGYVSYADSDDTSAWGAGLEANKYYDRWTLAGSVGYSEADEADDGVWGVNVGASVFASDNFRIDGQLSYASNDDDDVTGVGVGAEYQFDGLPISLGASYAHLDADAGDADTLGVTVRYNFGGGTLLDRDRNGASQANRVGFAGL